MEEKSAGVVFFNKEFTHVFLGHATGTPKWDIPKGHLEQGETAIEAAVRECKEEAGYVVSPSDLMYFGIDEKYSRNKSVEFFVYTGPEIDASLAECSAYFLTDEGPIPEMDRFKWVEFSKIPSYCGVSMARNLISIIDSFKI